MHVSCFGVHQLYFLITREFSHSQRNCLMARIICMPLVLASFLVDNKMLDLSSHNFGLKMEENSFTTIPHGVGLTFDL